MAVIGSPTYYQDSLSEINAAITSITVKGQRYQIGDRMLWRADLEFLVAERARLEPLALREVAGRTGSRLRRVVPL